MVSPFLWRRVWKRKRGRTQARVVDLVGVLVGACRVERHVLVRAVARLVLGDERGKHFGGAAHERVALLLEPRLVVGHSVVLPRCEGNVAVEVVLAVDARGGAKSGSGPGSKPPVMLRNRLREHTH